MLEKLVQSEDEILVFLHRGNLEGKTVLDEMEKIDDDLDAKGIELVAVSEKGIEKRLGFGFVPVLVLYHDQIPTVYRGDLEDGEQVRSLSSFVVSCQGLRKT